MRERAQSERLLTSSLRQLNLAEKTIPLVRKYLEGEINLMHQEHGDFQQWVQQWFRKLHSGLAAINQVVSFVVDDRVVEDKASDEEMEHIDQWYDTVNLSEQDMDVEDDNE